MINAICTEGKPSPIPKMCRDEEKRCEEEGRLHKKAKLRSVNKSLLPFRNLTGGGIMDGVLFLLLKKKKNLAGILNYFVKL